MRRSLIPWAAALILLILYFVKLFGLKSQVQAGYSAPKYGVPM